jgi:DNA polymerase-3 subunit alpha
VHGTFLLWRKDLGYIGIQSVYTFLKSTLTIESIVKAAKQRQHTSVILTDEHLHGMLSFFKLSKQQNLNPIFTQRITVIKEDHQYDVIIGIMTQKGYHNLIQINKYMSNQSLDFDVLIGHQEGLSITLYRLFEIYDPQTYMSQCFEFIKPFDTTFIGISFQTLEDDAFYTTTHEQLSIQTNKPIVHIHLTKHLNETDKETLDHVYQIGGQDVLTGKYHFLSLDAVNDMYLMYPKLKAGMQIYEKMHQFELSFPTFHLPQIPLQKGITSRAFLTSLAQVGLEKRFKNQKHIDLKVYRLRLAYELKVIQDLGYEDYFLVVYDIIKFAKTHDIYVGPGRGSVAGSLVAFALGITEVDPIKYDLLFERFLNPERKTMPDIDMDFPDDKRDDVILYAKSRFGEQHIASIVTFQTFGKKSAIRDLAKLFKFNANRTKYLTESILKEKIDLQDQEMVNLNAAVKQLEGIPRQTGTHAAGVILSKEPLDAYIPLSEGPYPFFQTQFEAKELESIGLLKMDFLGIRNLKIIDDVVKEIQKHDAEFSMSKVPLNDKKTFELLSSASTDGIFQLESHGMRQVLRKLKPDQFEDIIALLALYRPGPMAFIDTYIERRHGKTFEHMHPSFEPYLKSTYGIIVYQEQIMQIAQSFAGYSLSEADLLRRGISKKDETLLKSEAERFISKAIKHGQNAQDAKEVYDLIVRFSDYGFNRSHSVSYALVAYQMAYLKANHYVYFMQSLLNSVIGSEKAIDNYNKDLQKNGIQLLPPNIKVSHDQFEVISLKEIRAPLSIVKSIGMKTVNQMLSDRHQYTLDTWQNIKTWLKNHVSERQLTQLIHAGCFDDLNINRRTLIENSTFSDIEYAMYLDQMTMASLAEYDDDTLSELEKEALGFNLTYDLASQIRNIQTCFIDDIADRANVYIKIQSIKTIQTKHQETMAFMSCHDGQQIFELTVFPKVYQKYQPILTQGIFEANIQKQTYKEKTSYIGYDFKRFEKKQNSS